MWRLMQLKKSLARPDHPHRLFSTGNLQTLKDLPLAAGVNLRDRLLAFHAKFYSANQMRLVFGNCCAFPCAFLFCGWRVRAAMPNEMAARDTPLARVCLRGVVGVRDLATPLACCLLPPASAHPPTHPFFALAIFRLCAPFSLARLACA